MRAVGALPAEVAAVHKQAAKMIAAETRSRMADQMVSDDRSGRLEGSVKPKGTATSISVTIGNRQTPYAGWWEFGGWTKSPIGDTNREIVQGGRTLYPAVANQRPAIHAMLEGVATKVAKIIAGGGR